ncbi:MAG: murein L,D-transpeptidase catalytic domain family protein [Chitinophagales bacterium]|nr:murein L,D-transpeptidase catalytic domain family protein [Chitinophagales bacterium]
MTSSLFIGSCTSEESILEEKRIQAAKIEALQNKGNEALRFCKTKGYNTDFCILINMGEHSGLKRFYIWDFNNESIMYSFLVSHGCGESPWGLDFSRENPMFSNSDGSHLTSLGKYKIGERGYSNWGINVKYLMHGLEPSNNNALRRTIVFHSWDIIPNREVYPRGVSEGWGCPAVSNDAFRTIDPMLRHSSKPVLMWIYV